MIEELQKIVKDDFTKIANEVIKEEQSDLREQNREALEEKLKPIKDKFEEVKRQIEDFNKTEIKHTTELKSNIEGLIKESLSIKETANELTAAIKNNAQKRGVFGEIILENLLKQAGLINKNEDELKGNYITQKTFKDYAAPTEKPRPDAVIYLPENKNIIIDSKCPLNNFIEYCNNPDEGEKEKQLKQFYNSVSEMITDLSVKYNTLEGLQTPEFKLMFIPLESCASYIYANDELTKKSINNNIIIVCPSTLFATLKLVNQIWKRETQINDLDKIIKTATSTYNKLVTFVEKLEKVRTKFTETANSFDEVFTTATGQGGFVKQIANLEKVIVTPKKKLNEKYISE
jgi:DNA recombination protein RmuC